MPVYFVLTGSMSLIVIMTCVAQFHSTSREATSASVSLMEALMLNSV